MNEKEIKTVEDEAKTLLDEIGVTAQVSVSFEGEGEEERVNLQLESEEIATLIGFHGETLQSLQLILSFIVHRKIGRWVKVLLNVGDYRQKREEQLQKLAMNLAMKAKFSGEVQVIPNLNPSERRIVHLILTENPDVYTESEGEGRQRQLTIRPKK